MHTGDTVNGSVENLNIPELYTKILTSWDIDISSISNISVCEGTLFFIQNGSWSSCPLCEFHQYSDIVKNASSSNGSIGIRRKVKSIFWQQVAGCKGNELVQAISKQSKHLCDDGGGTEDPVKDIDYIHHLLGIPNIEIEDMLSLYGRKRKK